MGDYSIGNSISFRLQPNHDSQQGLILFPTFLPLRKQTLATNDADVKLVLLISFWESLIMCIQWCTHKGWLKTNLMSLSKGLKIDAGKC